MLMGMFNRRMAVSPIAWIIPALMLILDAMDRLPSEYYSLLGLVVPLTALFLVWKHSGDRSLWVYLMVLIFLVFNPIFPVDLHKEIWMNWTAGILFLLHMACNVEKPFDLSRWFKF